MNLVIIIIKMAILIVENKLRIILWLKLEALNIQNNNNNLFPVVNLNNWRKVNHLRIELVNLEEYNKLELMIITAREEILHYQILKIRRIRKVAK